MHHLLIVLLIAGCGTPTPDGPIVEPDAAVADSGADADTGGRPDIATDTGGDTPGIPDAAPSPDVPQDTDDAGDGRDADADAADAPQPDAEVDMGSPDLDPPPPEPAPEYDGDGIAPTDSPFMIRASSLALDGEQFALSVTPQSLAERTTGDTSTFSPWVVYRTADGADWGWLRLSVYASPEIAAGLVGRRSRVTLRRAGPWVASGQTLRGEQLADALETPGQPICGRASVGARFVLSDAPVPGEVTVVARFLRRRSPLYDEEVTGCSESSVPH